MDNNCQQPCNCEGANTKSVDKKAEVEIIEEIEIEELSIDGICGVY